MFTTGRLPNTTPATQKAKQAVAMTRNCGFLVENGPMDRCTQRMAEKEKREKKNLQTVSHLKSISCVENRNCYVSILPKMRTQCITVINKVVPRLPIEELMKVNFRRLTTSHHGDLWPPVSMAKREPEMIRLEQPLQRHNREYVQVKKTTKNVQSFHGILTQIAVYDHTKIWQGETQERQPVMAADLTPALKIKGGCEHVCLTRTQQRVTETSDKSYLDFDKQNQTVPRNSQEKFQAQQRRQQPLLSFEPRMFNLHGSVKPLAHYNTKGWTIFFSAKYLNE